MSLRRWLRVHPRTADTALAALVCVADLGLFLPVLARVPDGGVPGLPVLASALPYVALIWRRRFPLPVLAVMLGQLAVTSLLIAEYRPEFGALVALYTVATLHSAGVAGVAAVIVYAVEASTAIVDGLSQPLGPGESPEGVVRVLVVIYALLVVAAWGFGRFARATRLSAGYQAELAEVARRDAIRAERTAIAHDLHDVVAHAVVMMMLGTSAARFQLVRDPEQAASSLEGVEEAGTRAMAELRTMLDVLREVDDTRGPVVAESALAGLLPLVDSARRAGLVVAENRIGLPRQLERAADQAAIRIVQEALTNVVKHAGPGSHVVLDITWADDQLLLRVADDGRGEPVLTPAHHSARVGLAGLRERAASVGGQLEAGPSGPGFEVVARLPVATGILGDGGVVGG